MIRGYSYDPETGDQAPILPDTDLKALFDQPTTMLWLDLHEPTDGDLRLVDSYLHFHPLALEDAKQRQHHPKMEEFDDNLFIIVHTVRDDATPEEYRAVQMAMFLGRRYLITVHSPMDELDDLITKCAGGQKLLRNGPAALCHKIIDRMIDQYQPLLAGISRELEKAEETIFKEYTEHPLDAVFALKRSLSRIRQTAIHTKVTLHALANRKSEFIDADMQSYFRDVEDHAVRVIDECDAFREVVSDAIEAHASVTGHRLNQIMKVLTVITVVFVPLTFVAGIYGMNFDTEISALNMPELKWRYGYVAALALMGTVAGILIWVFKKRKWL